MRKSGIASGSKARRHCTSTIRQGFIALGLDSWSSWLLMLSLLLSSSSSCSTVLFACVPFCFPVYPGSITCSICMTIASVQYDLKWQCGCMEQDNPASMRTWIGSLLSTMASGQMTHGLNSHMISICRPALLTVRCSDHSPPMYRMI